MAHAVSPKAEEILDKEFKCLDYGFIRLIDYMGNDSSIVQAARVSYGKGTKTIQHDRTLIRYLMRHQHTSPFEMVEFKFHAKLPIFVARQWIRHRTANVNEYSGRYSEMVDEFYLPPIEELKKSSLTNKQGRGDEPLRPDQQKKALDILKHTYSTAYSGYEELLEIGLVKELSRIGLSLANYTEWYWKIDLHNLFNFLKLRLAPNAQKEIQVYANKMADMVEKVTPIAYEAFEDYTLKALKLSTLEQKILSSIIKNSNLDEELKTIDSLLLESKKNSKTEILYHNLSFSTYELNEFKEKLKLF